MWLCFQIIALMAKIFSNFQIFPCRRVLYVLPKLGDVAVQTFKGMFIFLPFFFFWILKPCLGRLCWFSFLFSFLPEADQGWKLFLNISPEHPVFNRLMIESAEENFVPPFSSSCNAGAISRVLFYLFLRKLSGGHAWLMGLVVWEVKLLSQTGAAALLVSKLGWATAGEGEVEIRAKQEQKVHEGERETMKSRRNCSSHNLIQPLEVTLHWCLHWHLHWMSSPEAGVFKPSPRAGELGLHSLLSRSCSSLPELMPCGSSSRTETRWS